MDGEKQEAEHKTRIMQTHKDLEIWKLGIKLVENVYKASHQFPKEELYGLTSQIRRSAVSVPSNIAEGAARSGSAEFIRFLYISLGSLSELETQLIIAERLGYIHNDNKIMKSIETLRKMMLNFIKYLKSK